MIPRFLGFGLLVQHIAMGMSFLGSQISIHCLVLPVFFATFRRKETNEIEIGNCNYL